MSVDKQYCMSSYLAFRYIEKVDMDFYEGLQHINAMATPAKNKIMISKTDDIENAILAQVASFENCKKD